VKNETLKDKVLSVITKKELTASDIHKKVNTKYRTDYHYNTVKTILMRLVDDGILSSKVKSGDGRHIKLFTIKRDAEKKEISGMVRNLFVRYGATGVRHLGEIFERELTDQEINEIKDKLDLE